MKTKLSTLLFAFSVFFICSDLKAQDEEPCVWPTYDVTASFAPGEVVFDLYQALTNDGIVFWDQTNCIPSIEHECFSQTIGVNEAFILFFPNSVLG